MVLCDIHPRPLQTVCGFEAFINGKHIVGQVKEKEQAHREYKEAISKGHGAYLMDEETPVSGRGGLQFVQNRLKFNFNLFCCVYKLLNVRLAL